MNDNLPTYSFLPWLRQGIANQIEAADFDLGVKLRASIDVVLRIQGKGLEAGTITSDITKTVGLYGPGDIVGIDTKSIIKTEPRNWITNFEPNYLPCIDFYDEDFPWRYTPSKPDANGRLRPWITLVVLKEGEEFDNGKNIAGRSLPYIELKIPAFEVFPSPEQLWAWAHVHVNRGLVDDKDQIVSEATDTVLDNFEATLRENPDLAYSRLICPRKLESNAAYYAFLIPTFESGRLAGLGLDVEKTFEEKDALNATFSAWGTYDSRQEPSYYPVYYRWYFRTGTIGDFEYLVRLLEPKPIDSRVGKRDMDVQEPGANIIGITDDPENGQEVPQLGGILKLGGALSIPEKALEEEEKAKVQKYDNWDQPYPRTFQRQLAAFINLADDYQQLSAKEAHQNQDLPEEIQTEAATENDPDPLITAPLYGRWHALIKRLLDEGGGIPDDNWVHELNLDPRYRVAAGFGTGVVQRNQEQYMDAAWEQVGKIIEANQRIRLAQLALSATRFWYNRYLQPLKETNEDRFVWLTQPVQKRVITQGFTAFHQVKVSKVPATTLSPSIRKFTRPRGRLSRALNLDSSDMPAASLVRRINRGEIQAAPPKTVPSEIPTLEDVADGAQPNNIPPLLLKWLRKHSWIRYIPLAIALIILILLVIIYGPTLSSITIGTGSIAGVWLLVATVLIYLFLWLRQWGNQIDLADSVKEENQRPEKVENLPKSPDFELTVPGQEVEYSKGRSDSQEAKRFKTALRDVGELLDASREVSEQPERPELNIGQIASDTLQTLNPDVTIPGRTFGSVYLPPHIIAQIGEVFREAMAYPEFDMPMYKPLTNISAELFLPNINYVEQNSISLLETNQKFIESYMVGLNHEFARELLWREYPTDQRGSYFRQFWDVSGFLDTESEDPEESKEKLKDIPPLHLWSKFSELGDHDHREASGDAEEEVVLVIRGELLKKYPNAVIYAHRAQWQTKSETDDTPDKAKERILAPLEGDEIDNPPRDKVKTPLYEAKVDPDIYFFGFDLVITEAQGLTEGEPADVDDRAGWFFVLKERPGEPRFGLDIGETEEGEIEVWNDLAWENVLPGATDGAFIQINDATPTIDISDNPLEDDDDEKIVQREDDIQVQWHKDMNAAEVAYILYQAPVMVAVHGAEMLPKP